MQYFENHNITDNITFGDHSIAKLILIHTLICFCVADPGVVFSAVFCTHSVV